MHEKALFFSILVIMVRIWNRTEQLRREIISEKSLVQ